MTRQQQFKSFGFIVEEPKARSPFLNKMKENIKKADELKKFVDAMNQKPTQKNLTITRNQGLEFREIENNKWQKVTTWYENFNEYHYILLYQEYTFKPYAIGRYTKN